MTDHSGTFVAVKSDVIILAINSLYGGFILMATDPIRNYSKQEPELKLGTVSKSHVHRLCSPISVNDAAIYWFSTLE
jgi:hypothetical protein